MVQSANQLSPMVAKADIRMRMLAFLVTGMAVFVFACLVWPLTVRSFRTSAAINVSAGSSIDAKALEQMLVEAIRLETMPASIDSIIDEIEESGKPNSKSIEYRDHEKIKSSIKLGVGTRPGGYRLKVVYDGQGGPDERSLIDKMAFRVAKRVSAASRVNPDDLIDSDIQLGDLKTNFDQATWILDQVETDLKYVADSLVASDSSSQSSTAIRLPSMNDTDSSSQEEASSRFMNASSTRVVSDSERLVKAIASIDINSLRSVIDRIEASVGPSGAIGSSGVIVNGLDNGTTTPLNGVPGIAPVLLFAMLAALVGSVVAWNFDPFEPRGFEGIQQVADKLGVPVLATLQDNNPGDRDAGRRIPLANQAVRICGLLLFGVFVVIAVFVILNPGVRETFFANPFYGCTKIVRIFAGY